MTQRSASTTKISGDVGLRNASGLAQLLRDALAATDMLRLDVAGITTADITTVQLLLAAHKQALAAGKSVTLAAPPQGVLRDFLIAAGCLDAQGKALLGDAAFFVSQSPRKDQAA